MSLFSAIKNIVSKPVEAFKKTFLPSAEVSAKRRLDTFGTTSKTVAATVIVGTAAALIAAPSLITKAGGIKQAAATVVKAVIPKSTTGKVISAFAAPAVVGAVVGNPKIITKTAGGIINLESNIYELLKDPSLENAKTLVTENPVIVGGLAAAGLIVTGGGIATIASIANTAAVKESTEATKEAVEDILLTETSKEKETQLPIITPGLPPAVLPTDKNKGASLVPITPETQVLGKAAKSPGVTRSKSSKRAPRSSNNQNLRVNIYNQTKTLYTGRQIIH